jgi:hypothetical protein
LANTHHWSEWSNGRARKKKSGEIDERKVQERPFASTLIQPYFLRMTTAKRTLGLVIAGMAMLATARADPLAQAVSGNKNGEDEKAVFVTGSLIPKRVKIKAIGTNTTAPLRVFTRAEMDRTGRFTTEGILAQDPSVRIIGNGSH